MVLNTAVMMTQPHIASRRIEFSFVYTLKSKSIEIQPVLDHILRWFSTGHRLKVEVCDLVGADALPQLLDSV